MQTKWRVLVAIAFGTYVATMDFSIVNIALPTLSREFDASPDTVIWATLIFSLTATSLTLTAGRVGDLFGRRRVYLTGWIIFTIGMAGVGFTQSIGQLITLRAVQAIGMSMVVANGTAIVVDAFPASERGRALGGTNAAVGAGLMSGPILGGVILSLLDWRAIFYLRVPLGIAVFLMVLLVVRERSSIAAGRRMDIAGALTLFGALGGTILAMNRGVAWGWTSPAILGLFAIGVISLVAFIRIEGRSPGPIISLALFRIRTFSLSALSLMLNFVGQSAVTFLMPFYLIQVLDYSTAHAGLVIVTIPVLMLALAPLSGYVADRFGFRYQQALGSALVTLGLLSLTTLAADTPMAAIMARMALIGLGSAIFQSPNSSAIMGSVPPQQLGTASASVATSRNIGNATGLALMGTIVVAVASSHLGSSAVSTDQIPSDVLLDGIRAGFLAGGAISVLAVVAAALPTGQPRMESNDAAHAAPAIQQSASPTDVARAASD
ncbi:MAG: MFS transporter [Dehalococcoidia bacterium]